MWEFSLGVYLVIKGFRAPALLELGFEPGAHASDVPGSATAANSELRAAA